MEKPTHEQLTYQNAMDAIVQYMNASFNQQAALELKELEIAELKKQLAEVMPEYERRGTEIKRLLEIIDSQVEDIKALASRDILDIPVSEGNYDIKTQ